MASAWRSLGALLCILLSSVPYLLRRSGTKDTEYISREDEISSLLQVQLQGNLSTDPSDQNRASIRSVRLQKHANATRALTSSFHETPEVTHVDADSMADGTKDSGLPERIWEPGAFLLAFSPTSCQEAVWDMPAYSTFNRVFIPFLYCCCFVAAIVAGAKAEGEGQSDSPEAEAAPVSQRRPDLDLARILCICCVVMEHSGYSNYSHHNVFVGLCWVLPFLYMTSAIAWMRSKRSFPSYSFHLVVILVVGVLANWIADIIIGRNWQTDFGNTVFQMTYIIMLLLMALVTTPLREALRTAKGGGATWHQLQWQFFFALFCLVFLTLWGLFGYINQNGTTMYARAYSWAMEKTHRSDDFRAWAQNSGMNSVVDNLDIALVEVAGILLIAHVACLFRANDLLAWILVVHVFVARIFAPWKDVGYMHNLELYVFGMVADCWRMRGESRIQTAVQNYWPIMIAALMFAALPSVVGRCDLMPPALVSERWRFYGGELIMCVCLVTESFKVGDPWNCLPWMTYWALYAYCVHVAWARIFPVPVGLFVTCGSAVFFPWIYSQLHGPPKDSQGLSKSIKDPQGTEDATLDQHGASRSLGSHKSRRGWPPS